MGPLMTRRKVQGAPPGQVAHPLPRGCRSFAAVRNKKIYDILSFFWLPILRCRQQPTSQSVVGQPANQSLPSDRASRMHQTVQASGRSGARVHACRLANAPAMRQTVPCEYQTVRASRRCDHQPARAGAAVAGHCRGVCSARDEPTAMSACGACATSASLARAYPPDAHTDRAAQACAGHEGASNPRRASHVRSAVGDGPCKRRPCKTRARTRSERMDTAASPTNARGAHRGPISRCIVRVAPQQDMEGLEGLGEGSIPHYGHDTGQARIRHPRACTGHSLTLHWTSPSFSPCTRQAPPTRPILDKTPPTNHTLAARHATCVGTAPRVPVSTTIPGPPPIPAPAGEPGPPRKTTKKRSAPPSADWP